MALRREPWRTEAALHTLDRQGGGGGAATHLASGEEVAEASGGGHEDVAAALDLPQLVADAGATVDDDGPVDGAVHKLPGLLVDLEGELSGRGDDEGVGRSRVAGTGSGNIISDQASDDGQEEGSLGGGEGLKHWPLCQDA